MNKKELWKIFMKTGKVSDYLNYKNARDNTLTAAFPDAEFSQEFSQEFINNFDSDFPAVENRSAAQYSDDYEDFCDYDY